MGMSEDQGAVVRADLPHGQDLLTVEEFAAITRRTPAAVRSSIQRGEIRAHKLGTRRWFIRWQDVEQLFEEAHRRA